MEYILILTSSYLIEVMLSVLIVALSLRFLAHRASKSDQLYYTTFVREIEKRVERDDIAKIDVSNTEAYVEKLLDEVSTSLPTRGVRVKNTDNEPTSRRKMSVREYSGGSQSLIHSLKSETNAFKTKQKPNFEQLTHRIMSKDDHWVKLHGMFQVDSIIRIIDVLPGIFIVIGIFGTFVGITSALPSIANIDFNNISNSSSVLSSFVKDVSFAMHTSIAGIAFSLIISLLNTLFPISTMRDSLSRAVEDCLEYLWYFVHGGKGKGGPEEAYSQMIELLENIEEKIEDSSSGSRSSDSRDYEHESFSKIVSLLEKINQKFTGPMSSEGKA